MEPRKLHPPPAVAFPFSRGSSQPRHQTQVSHIACAFFYQLSHKGGPCVSVKLELNPQLTILTHWHLKTTAKGNDFYSSRNNREYLLLQFSCSVVSKSLRPNELQYARLPCPTPIPRAYSNSCPSGWWCHPTISSSIVPFSSHLQSFPTSGSFPVSQFFASGGQSIGVSASASVLPMNIQDWFPLGWTGWIYCLVWTIWSV